ncbi:flagellar protein FlhE [Enterobacter hormaechei]
MIRAALLVLLLAPPAFAADGSWSSHSFGGTLSRGKQVLKSRPVQPAAPLPKGVTPTHLLWKITPDGPTPPGFRIRVCNNLRCLMLRELAGEIPLPAGFPAAGPFRFEYQSVARGEMTPPLTILKNEITIRYHGKGPSAP